MNFNRFSWWVFLQVFLVVFFILSNFKHDFFLVFLKTYKEAKKL